MKNNSKSLVMNNSANNPTVRKNEQQQQQQQQQQQGVVNNTYPLPCYRNFVPSRNGDHCNRILTSNQFMYNHHLVNHPSYQSYLNNSSNFSNFNRQLLIPYQQQSQMSTNATRTHCTSAPIRSQPCNSAFVPNTNRFVPNSSINNQGDDDFRNRKNNSNMDKLFIDITNKERRLEKERVPSVTFKSTKKKSNGDRLYAKKVPSSVIASIEATVKSPTTQNTTERRNDRNHTSNLRVNINTKDQEESNHAVTIQNQSITNKSSKSAATQSNNSETIISNLEHVPSDGKKKSLPRLKHVLKKIETSESEKNPFQRLHNQRQSSNSSITFESLSNYYPLNQNKRLASSSSSTHSSSSSSSPATVPSIVTEELNEQETNKRRKVSEGSTSSSGSNLDILCQAVTIVVSKKEEEDSRKHINAIEIVRRKKSCNCPKSRCIKLYCECFQEGRLCTDLCSCKNCKNTKKETGPNGMRTMAIQNILARNPHAFSKDKAPPPPPTHDGIVCGCVKSRCLKLYCDCFQTGQLCGEYCSCINCFNTEAESGEKGKRSLAIKACLERNPDAFKKKEKNLGYCSCKFSR